jgi:t-SNARE complex subunit (syntaxin)
MENSLPDPTPARTLFSISADIQQLNAVLDDLDDTEQQQFITDWLENLETERDRKLDNYATLITELEARADVRKAEAKRLMELVAADEKRAKLLKERLKYFFETNQLKKVETNRYRLSLVKHGGKAPLILDESVEATLLPERFRRVNIEPDTKAIREALEAGEQLDFAQLGDRGSSIRIT